MKPANVKAEVNLTRAITTSFKTEEKNIRFYIVANLLGYDYLFFAWRDWIIQKSHIVSYKSI